MRLIHVKLGVEEQYLLDNLTVKNSDGILYIAKDSSKFEIMKKTLVGGKEQCAATDGYRMYIFNTK